METVEYQKLAEYENWYWWYRAQRHIVVDAVRRLKLAPGARLLDAGCGSGRNAQELCRRLKVAGYGIDSSAHAAALWNGDSTIHRCLGSVNRLPFPDASFDAVVSVDVVGCQGVDAQGSISEMARVARPGGGVVLVVPAYQWLLSRHDLAVHSVHRFTRGEVRSLAGAVGLRVERLTHLFPAFFPAVALTRVVRKVGMGDTERPVRSDLTPLPRWINAALFAAARVEYGLVGRLAVPFGSTILAVTRKEHR